MANYYMYRINPAYDGFLPSTIPDRTKRNILKFNWGAYLENLELGDVVLTYFSGRGCTAGIYAIAVIRSTDVASNKANVAARLLYYSSDNQEPVIGVRGHRLLFDAIRTRRRGAEVVVPSSCVPDVYEALEGCRQLLAEAAKWNITLPGAPTVQRFDLQHTPLVSLEGDLSPNVQDTGVVPAFWIRPRQASWITRAPAWLHQISSVFESFKSGDMSHLGFLVGSVLKQIQFAARRTDRVFAAIISVPLNEKKRSRGELDRVGKLARALSQRMGVPYCDLFTLHGDISRRLYKRLGYSSDYFRREYTHNLDISVTQQFIEVARSGKSIILIDDVYTDGVTTATVIEALRAHLLGVALDITVATIGIMAKQRNMDTELVQSWR